MENKVMYEDIIKRRKGKYRKEYLKKEMLKNMTMLKEKRIDNHRNRNRRRCQGKWKKERGENEEEKL